MTLYLLADDIDPWTGWLEYGLLHTLWDYRTIPPVQKLSVLVPETQAPAPILLCTRVWSVWLLPSGPSSPASVAWSGGFSQPQEEINAVPEESKL